MSVDATLLKIADTGGTGLTLEQYSKREHIACRESDFGKMAWSGW